MLTPLHAAETTGIDVVIRHHTAKTFQRLGKAETEQMGSDPICSRSAGVAGGLAAVVIWAFVDDDRLSDQACHPELIGVESHDGAAVVGEEYGEVPGVVAVVLVGLGSSVSYRCEWYDRVSDLAAAILVNMKTMEADELLTATGVLVGDNPCSNLTWIILIYRKEFAENGRKNELI